MAVQTSELLLRLRDGLSAPARIAEKALQGLNKAITSSITNKSGVGFGAASAAMRKDALEIKRSVASVEHSTHALGAALAGLGIGHEFGEFMKAGADYRKELVALKNSGKTSGEIAASMKAAAGIATALPTQTFADSIKIINETTAAYGDLGHALENLKFNSKFESNMKSVLGEHADPHMLQNMVRALEIRGTAFNPEKYQEEAGKLGKAFAFTRGAVNPENFYDFAKNSNPDIKGFSTEFLTEVVPSLIQTFSAPGAGTGLKAFEKVWRGGLTDKSQAAEWVRVGMVSAKAVQDNKGQSPGWKSGAAAFSQLARENPLEAMTKLLEKLQKIGVDITDPNKLGPELDKLFKNGKARAMAYELGQAVTRQALTKDARLIRASASMDEQYENNKDNLDKAKEAIKAAFENLMASMSGPLITTVAHGLWNLALGVQHLAVTLHDHPLLGGALGLTASVGAATAGILVLRSGLSLLGLTGLRPIAAINGALVSMRAAAIGASLAMGRGFLTLLNPLALVRGAVFGIGVVIRGLVYTTGIGALIAAGVLLYQNWDNVRVAFEAFRGAFMRALGPALPVLRPIIQDVGRLWDMVSGLIQPTGDMGAAWAQAGIKLGTLLGKDLAPWAQSIRDTYEVVKSLGRYWGDVVAIITSDDPIGRAVTALTPAFNRMLAEIGNSIRTFDWGGAWDQIRAQADPVLTRFFTGWVDYAKRGATSFMSYDWAGLAKTVADALGAALSTDGAIIGNAFVDLAKAGWNAFIGYDWIGLGTKVVEAIIQGIANMAGSVGGALRNIIPGFGGGGGSGGGGSSGSDGGGGGGGGAKLGDRARGGAHGWKGNFGQTGWWTPDRQSHFVDRLMKESGLNEAGAKALVSRWMYVEAPGGPTAVNPRSGAAGIAQGLGIRRAGYTGNGEDQLTNAIRELNGTESRAKRILNTPGMEAEGASAFERAEHYGRGNNPGRNAGTDRDDFTDRTAEGMKHVYHGPVTAPTAVAPSPAGTSQQAVTDAEVFAARQRILNGSRDPKDKALVDRYKQEQTKPESPKPQASNAARRHVATNHHQWHLHLHDMGGHDPDQIADAVAGKVAGVFHEHGHAGAAGNFADV